LTFEERAKSMNMTALQFRKQLAANLHRASAEGRPEQDVLEKRLGLLRSILQEN
jgi:hypothetical protein